MKPHEGKGRSLRLQHCTYEIKILFQTIFLWLPRILNPSLFSGVGEPQLSGYSHYLLKSAMGSNCCSPGCSSVDSKWMNKVAKRIVHQEENKQTNKKPWYSCAAEKKLKKKVERKIPTECKKRCSCPITWLPSLT